MSKGFGRHIDSEDANASIPLEGEERRLLHLLLTGHTVTSAAYQMFISVRKAESILADLRTRTETSNLYGLGAAAERQGWHKSQYHVDCGADSTI